MAATRKAEWTVPLSQQRLSDLIGSIYDCAIDPQRWPATVEQICRELRCKSGNIMLIDSLPRQLSYAVQWNFQKDVMAGDYLDAIIKWWELLIPFLLARPLDRPFASSHFNIFAIANGGAPEYLGRRPSFAQLAKIALQYQRHQTASFYQRLVNKNVEKRWGQPEALDAALEESPTGMIGALIKGSKQSGLIDTLSTVVLRDGSRIGLFNADRDRAEGPAEDEELEILALLAPHIRRAITISDLLGLKAVEAHALGATLDQFALGVVVVDADHNILHANGAAKSMLAKSSPIQSTQGRLHVSGAADEQLEMAIARTGNEANIGQLGIGISLQGGDGEVAIAHVLPLVQGEVRSRLVAQASAAIFITRPGKDPSPDLAAFAATFALTPAEARVLQQLLQGGGTMQEIADALSVSEATAKTHLSRILAKTGVGRQTELVALVRDLVPPVAAGAARA